MHRTLDPEFLNAVANHPDVRPYLGGEGELDLTAVIINPENITLQTEWGGFILHNHGAGLYESHSLFMPGSGSAPTESAREGFRMLFTASDCVEVVTKVPGFNKAALGLARAVGFQLKFERPDVWQGPEGLCKVGYYGLTLERWMLRDEACLEAGEGDDEACRRAFGFMRLCAAEGLMDKGVVFYNRFAALAGIQPVVIAPMVVRGGEPCLLH